MTTPFPKGEKNRSSSKGAKDQTPPDGKTRKETQGQDIIKPRLSLETAGLRKAERALHLFLWKWMEISISRERKVEFCIERLEKRR